MYAKRAAFYEKWYVGRLGWGRELDAFFRGYDFLRPSHKVLDAGCGTGVITRTLYRIAEEKHYEGIWFHAFDMKPNMLDIFQERIEERGFKDVDIAQADVLMPESIPTAWKDYNLVVSSALLEYIPKE
jgi:ubiquinone/menaquinone biosynthesis C-methylase UbiE